MVISYSRLLFVYVLLLVCFFKTQNERETLWLLRDKPHIYVSIQTMG